MKILIEKFNEEIVKVCYIFDEGKKHIQVLMNKDDYSIERQFELAKQIESFEGLKECACEKAKEIEKIEEPTRPAIVIPSDTPESFLPKENEPKPLEEPRRKRRSKKEIEEEKAQKYGTPILPPETPIEPSKESDGFDEIEEKEAEVDIPEVTYGSLQGAEENQTVGDLSNVVFYEKGNQDMKQACFTLMTNLTKEVFWPKNPKLVEAAKKAVDVMIEKKMIFFRNGVVSSEVVDLFTDLVQKSK